MINNKPFWSFDNLFCSNNAVTLCNHFLYFAFSEKKKKWIGSKLTKTYFDNSVLLFLYFSWTMLIFLPFLNTYYLLFFEVKPEEMQEDRNR